MFDKMIKQRISFEISASAGIVIETVFHLLESEGNKYKALVSELETDKKSKFVDNFDRQENLKKFHTKYLKNEIQNR